MTAAALPLALGLNTAALTACERLIEAIALVIAACPDDSCSLPEALAVLGMNTAALAFRADRPGAASDLVLPDTDKEELLPFAAELLLLFPGSPLHRPPSPSGCPCP